MNATRQAAVVACVLALIVYPSATHAQATILDSLVLANARVISLSNGTLGGPGAEELLTRAAEAQFVVLGEEHNATEIPEFTTALFNALQDRYGYHYLALEQDPAAMQWASTPAVRGNLDSLTLIARRYPHAFTFVSDQELAMVAAVARASRARSSPVWGCDQAFGATHVLDRLLAIAPASAAGVIRALRDTVAGKERVRDLERYHYMAMEPKGDAFERVARALNPGRGSEAEFLIQSLSFSAGVYRDHREGRRYQANAAREEYLKARFLQEYRRARAAGDTLPRVVLKFGHWHLFRGLGPNNLQTLGNFVSEFAVANGSQSLQIALFPHGQPGGYGDLAGWQDHSPGLMARGLARTQWTLVDLKALRPQYSAIASSNPDQAEPLRRWIFGFDYALFMGGLTRASYWLNPGVEY